MKRYPWETETRAFLRRTLWSIGYYHLRGWQRLGMESLSTPNQSPVAMPGWKQEQST
jgi:hypothetical protein